jgi:hypothetical protein
MIVPMALLRYLLFTLLVLRIAAGGAWAMPVQPAAASPQETAMAMPCHGDAANSGSADIGLADQHHATSAHCALCFPATSTAFTLPLASVVHSVPVAPTAQAFHRQRTPELRPPI